MKCASNQYSSSTSKTSHALLASVTSSLQMSSVSEGDCKCAKCAHNSLRPVKGGQGNYGVEFQHCPISFHVSYHSPRLFGTGMTGKLSGLGKCEENWQLIRHSTSTCKPAFHEQTIRRKCPSAAIFSSFRAKSCMLFQCSLSAGDILCLMGVSVLRPGRHIMSTGFCMSG